MLAQVRGIRGEHGESAAVVTAGHVPLAGVEGRIAPALQPLTQVGHVRLELVAVAQHPILGCRSSGEPACARRTAHRVGRVGLREGRPSPHEAVHVRGLHVFAPQAGDRLEVLLVCVDEEKIRLGLRQLKVGECPASEGEPRDSKRRSSNELPASNPRAHFFPPPAASSKYDRRPPVATSSR